MGLRRIFKDSGHLVRPAVVLLAGLGIFLIIRALVIPKAFGQYGHYRPAALEEIRQRPIAYAGQDQCVLCHDDEAKARAAGKHAHVACEACHGPLAQHASDPSAHVPKLPDVANLCRRCHEKDAAKPPNFPQVVTAEHSGGMLCNSCHQPHNPHL
jgi:ABC-type nickel/cobalt efflux system permease component RcnA